MAVIDRQHLRDLGLHVGGRYRRAAGGIGALDQLAHAIADEAARLLKRDGAKPVARQQFVDRGVDVGR